MKNFTKPLSVVAVAVAMLVCHSCMDKDMQLDNINPEITVGNHDFTLPIGYINERPLGELLDLEAINGTNADGSVNEQGLRIDADGNYYFGYDGNAKAEISGVDNRFEVDPVYASVSATYPDFDISGIGYDIVKKPDVDISDSILAVLSSITSMPFDFPIDIVIDGMNSEKAEVKFDFNMPDDVSGINYVTLCTDPNDPNDRGAEVKVALDLGTMSTLNPGGTIELKVIFPDNYEITDDQGNVIPCEYARSVVMQPEQRSASLTFYVRKIYFNNYPITEEGSRKKMHINDDLKYSLEYSFVAKKGLPVDTSELPYFELSARLGYKDANIYVKDLYIDKSESTHEEVIDVEFTLPGNDMVKSISKVEFADSEICLNMVTKSVNGTPVDIISDNIAEKIDVLVKLPKAIRVAPVEGYNETDHSIRASVKRLLDGIHLRFTEFVLEGAEQLPSKNLNGESVMKLQLPISFEVLPIKNGSFNASDVFLGEGIDRNIVIEAGVRGSDPAKQKIELTILNVTGRVDYALSEEQKRDMNMKIDLSQLSNYNVEVGNLDLEPVLDFSIVNPFGVAINATLNLTPMITEHEAGVNTERIDVRIVPAAADGSPVTSNFVIANTRPQGLPADAQWVQCDLTKIFEGQMPKSIKVDFDISTDSAEESTIRLQESFEIPYNYNFYMPLDFGPGLDITYSETIGNLNDTFSSVSELGISRIGDVAIFADITNSTPLDLVLDAAFTDQDGREIVNGAKLVVDEENNIVRGSRDGNGVETRVVIRLYFGEMNRIDSLLEVYGLKLKLKVASSSSQGGVLNREQWVSAKLKLNIKGGVTIEIFTPVEDIEN